MRISWPVFVALALLPVTAVRAAEPSIRTAAELKRLLYDEPKSSCPFALTGEVRHVRESAQQSVAWAIHDDSGDVIVTAPRSVLPKEVPIRTSCVKPASL